MTTRGKLQAYTVFVKWQNTGTYVIEAESVEEAIDRAYDIDELPHDEEYAGMEVTYVEDGGGRCVFNNSDFVPEEYAEQN